MEKHSELEEYQAAEILRTPLEGLCLQIKSLGRPSVASFLSKALQAPDSLAVSNALSLLHNIGALNVDEELTSLGRCSACLLLGITCLLPFTNHSGLIGRWSFDCQLKLSSMRVLLLVCQALESTAS